MKRKAVRGIFCLALGITVLWSGSLPAADDPDDDRSGLSTSEVRRIPAADIVLVEFQPANNIRGEIRLRTDIDVGDVNIEIKKNLYNISPGEQATKILESISVETKVAGDNLQIGVNTPEHAEWQGSQIGVTVDLEILLPPGRIFRGDSEHFDFVVGGPFREVQIFGTYGKILVEEVTESANLHAEYGTLILAGAQGQVEVSNHYGTILLKNITGLTEPLKVRSKRGEVELDATEGPVDIRVDYAPVTISNWTVRNGSSRIFTDNSPVTIGLMAWEKPQVTIRSRNSKVTVSTPEDFSALVRLSIGEEGGGYIRTRGLPVKVTHLDQYSVEGIVSNGDGLLEVTIEGRGDIMLRGSHPRVRKDEDDSI
jgi:hypothetical protein